MPKININHLNFQDTKEREAPAESGPWKAEVWVVDGKKKTVLQSDDFTHDVTLYVTGDFVDDQQRLEYAQMIADRLNRTPQE